MKAQGLCRIGRDAEVRFTSSGEPVVNLSLAFTYGKKGEDGKRPTQWVKGSFWGKRAENLAPYLLKGKQIVAYLEDVCIETFEGQNGPVTSLAGRVADVELIADKREEGQSGSAAPAPRQSPPPAARPAQRDPVREAQQRSNSGFDDDFESDIPF